MKKILIVILSCLLIVSIASFAACDITNQNSSGNASSQSDGDSSNSGEQGGGEDIQEQYSEGLDFESSVISSRYGCIGLGTCTDSVIKVPPTYNGVPVEGIFSVFENCQFVESITIPRGVLHIQDDFSNCPNLKVINIPCTATELVIDCGENKNLVINCEVPESFIERYDHFKIKGSAKVNYSYNNIISGTYDYVVEKDKAYLTNYKGNNTDVIIPDKIDGREVAGIYKTAFRNNDKIASINIPDTLKYIDEYAFGNCNKLRKVNINDIEAWCNIEFEDSHSNPLSNSFWGGDLYLNDKLIEELVIPDSVTSIGDYTFDRCNLTSVKIPDSVTSIGERAFASCGGLTSVEIPDSVMNIGNYAFRACSNLTSVTIGNGVTSIGYSAFSACKGLENITVSEKNAKYYSEGNCLIERETKELISGCKTSVIPDDVASIGGSAFEDCSGLTSIEIGNSVKGIGNKAFSNCTGLTSVVIGNSVTSIGSYAFYRCNLTSVKIPDSVTSIGGWAFESCSGLTSVVIPDSVTSIGSSAFSNCDGLISVTIGNGVTSIGSSAFAYCSGLTSVVIPDSVTSIGYNAFNDCSKLKEVYYKGSQKDWNKISIGDSNDELTKATLYYYSETKPTVAGNYWHYVDNKPTKW